MAHPRSRAYQVPVGNLQVGPVAGFGKTAPNPMLPVIEEHKPQGRKSFHPSSTGVGMVLLQDRAGARRRVREPDLFSMHHTPFRHGFTPMKRQVPLFRPHHSILPQHWAWEADLRYLRSKGRAPPGGRPGRPYAYLLEESEDSTASDGLTSLSSGMATTSAGSTACSASRVASRSASSAGIRRTAAASASATRGGSGGSDAAAAPQPCAEPSGGSTSCLAKGASVVAAADACCLSRPAARRSRAASASLQARRGGAEEL